MGFIAFLILGLIAGAIAKAILPGRQGGGWIATLVLGVIGALLGSWIAGLVDTSAELFTLTSITTWIFAILGSIIVLVIYGFLTRKSGSRA